tara:strand:- start:239 stop:2353 length:2115 start_codon:yes stop_codon:yes gene_type:complete
MSSNITANKEFLINLVKEQMGVGEPFVPPARSSQKPFSPAEYFKSIKKDDNLRWLLSAGDILFRIIPIKDKKSRMSFVVGKASGYFDLEERLQVTKFDTNRIGNIKKAQYIIDEFNQWYGSTAGLRRLGPEGLRSNQKGYAALFVDKFISTNESTTNADQAILKILNLREQNLLRSQASFKRFSTYYEQVLLKLNKEWKRTFLLGLKSVMFESQENRETISLFNNMVVLLTGLLAGKAMAVGVPTAITIDTLFYTTLESYFDGESSFYFKKENTNNLISELEELLSEIESKNEQDRYLSDDLNKAKQIIREIDRLILIYAKNLPLEVQDIVFTGADNPSQLETENPIGNTNKFLRRYIQRQIKKYQQILIVTDRLEGRIRTTLRRSFVSALDSIVKKIEKLPVPRALPLQEETAFGIDNEKRLIKRKLTTLIGKSRDAYAIDEYVDAFTKNIRIGGGFAAGYGKLKFSDFITGDAGLSKQVVKAKDDVGGLWQGGEKIRSAVKAGRGDVIVPNLFIDQLMTKGWVGFVSVDLYYFGGGNLVLSLGFLHKDGQGSIMPISYMSKATGGSQSAALANAIHNGKIGPERKTSAGKIINAVYPKTISESDNGIQFIFKKIDDKINYISEIIESEEWKIVTGQDKDFQRKYGDFLSQYAHFHTLLKESIRAFIGIPVGGRDKIDAQQGRSLLDNIANLFYWATWWSRYE